MRAINFKILDRIQQLRESVEDIEIKQKRLEHKIKGIALEEGWQIQIDLHIAVAAPVVEKAPTEKEDDIRIILGAPLYEAVKDSLKFKQTGFVSSYSSERGITVRSHTALKMLLIYKEDLEAERVSAYKALEEAIYNTLEGAIK